MYFSLNLDKRNQNKLKFCFLKPKNGIKIMLWYFSLAISLTPFISALKLFDYEVVRQNGSHIRIKTELNGEHSETIPNHKPIKIGTLNGILNSIAEHFDMMASE